MCANEMSLFLQCGVIFCRIHLTLRNALFAPQYLTLLMTFCFQNYAIIYFDYCRPSQLYVTCMLYSRIKMSDKIYRKSLLFSKPFYKYVSICIYYVEFDFLQNL